MAVENYPVTQEIFSTDERITILRIRVPGGWIVTVRDEGVTDDYSTSFFVSNPDGLWGKE